MPYPTEIEENHRYSLNVDSSHRVYDKQSLRITQNRQLTHTSLARAYMRAKRSDTYAGLSSTKASLASKYIKHAFAYHPPDTLYTCSSNKKQMNTNTASIHSVCCCYSCCWHDAFSTNTSGIYVQKKERTASFYTLSFTVYHTHLSYPHVYLYMNRGACDAYNATQPYLSTRLFY